ncbi:Peroxisomal acyl-coenzyme A oxidase 1-like 2, partial [Homarus americanus]
MVSETAARLQEYCDMGRPFEHAWNSSSVLLVKCAQAHIRYFTCEKYVVGVENPGLSEGVQNVLRQLCRLYLIYHITLNQGDFLRSGALTGYNMSILEGEMCRLLAALRPDAVSLVDSFDVHDRILDSTLGWEYGINESTVRYIKKKEREIHNVVALSSPSSAKVASSVRDTAMVKMEKALNISTEDFNHCHIPLCQKFNRDKAEVLYDRFHAEEGGEGEASGEDCFSFIKQCHDDLTASVLTPAGGPCVQRWQTILLASPQSTRMCNTWSSLPGFDNLQEEEVQEELLGHAGEELAELVEEQHCENEEEGGEEEEVPTLTVTNINRGLLSSRALMDYFFYVDPSFERSVKFKRGMEEDLVLYKEILKELKCQVGQPTISISLSLDSSHTRLEEK